ncbi:MAG: hypothetical protein ACOC7O_00650 [Thermoplasmatota archaeon]
MNDKMEKTTIHINRELKRKVIIYKGMADLSTNEEAVEELITLGLENCGYDIKLPEEKDD